MCRRQLETPANPPSSYEGNTDFSLVLLFLKAAMAKIQFSLQPYPTINKATKRDKKEKTKTWLSDSSRNLNCKEKSELIKSLICMLFPSYWSFTEELWLFFPKADLDLYSQVNWRKRKQAWLTASNLPIWSLSPLIFLSPKVTELWNYFHMQLLMLWSGHKNQCVQPDFSEFEDRST